MNPSWNRAGALAISTLVVATVLTPVEARSQADVGRAVIPIDRSVRTIDRRVVAFDGRQERLVGTTVTVTLDADVLFDFDQAGLTPQAERTLADLGAELNDTLAGDTITVVGHTDSKGTDAYNQDLSQRRAVSVREFLGPLLQRAVTIDIDGRGEAEPVAPNQGPGGGDDADGRRRNRRVEISYTVDDDGASR